MQFQVYLSPYLCFCLFLLEVSIYKIKVWMLVFCFFGCVSFHKQWYFYGTILYILHDFICLMSKHFVILVTSSRTSLFSWIPLLLASLLDVVANTGVVELGEKELAIYLADKSSTGKPFFRNGMCWIQSNFCFCPSVFVGSL